MPKIIKAVSGQEIIVDDCDYSTLSQVSWGINSSGYARRTIRKPENPSGFGCELMHRVILNTPEGLETDHINGNRLDNRRENLRPATRSLNVTHRRKKLKAHTSRYIGVEFSPKLKARPWAARVTIDGIRYHLGMYGTEEEAAKARDEFMRKKVGTYFVPNFK